MQVMATGRLAGWPEHSYSQKIAYLFPYRKIGVFLAKEDGRYQISGNRKEDIYSVLPEIKISDI